MCAFKIAEGSSSTWIYWHSDAIVLIHLSFEGPFFFFAFQGKQLLALEGLYNKTCPQFSHDTWCFYMVSRLLTSGFLGGGYRFLKLIWLCFEDIQYLAHVN